MQSTTQFQAQMNQPTNTNSSTQARTMQKPQNKSVVAIAKPETVENRMTGMLQKDSPYLERARQKANDFSASRGLLNSSMAAGHAEGAAIDAALPIAQQDAQQINQFKMQDLTHNQQLERDETQQGYQQDNMRLDTTLKKDINQQQQDFQQSNMQLDSSLQKDRNYQQHALDQSDMRLDSSLKRGLMTQEHNQNKAMQTHNTNLQKSLNTHNNALEIAKMTKAHGLDLQKMDKTHALKLQELDKNFKNRLAELDNQIIGEQKARYLSAYSDLNKATAEQVAAIYGSQMKTSEKNDAVKALYTKHASMANQLTAVTKSVAGLGYNWAPNSVDRIAQPQSSPGKGVYQPPSSGSTVPQAGGSGGITPPIKIDLSGMKFSMPKFDFGNLPKINLSGLGNWNMTSGFKII